MEKHGPPRQLAGGISHAGLPGTRLAVGPQREWVIIQVGSEFSACPYQGETFQLISVIPPLDIVEADVGVRDDPPTCPFRLEKYGGQVHGADVGLQDEGTVAVGRLS